MESKIAHFGLAVSPSSRKDLLEASDGAYEGTNEKEAMQKLSASNQQMAVLGLNSPGEPYSHEMDNGGKFKRMASEASGLMKWGMKHMRIEEKVKVKATHVGLLEDESAVVAKLEPNSANCADEEQKEKVRDVLQKGMNGKQLHVVIRKKQNQSSAEVAGKVRKGEVKYKSLKQPVELDVVFMERSGQTVGDLNNAKLKKDPQKKREALKEEDEMTRVGTHTVKTHAVELSEFSWKDGSGILAKETPTVISLAVERMTNRGDEKVLSPLSMHMVRSLCPLPAPNAGFNERRNAVLCAGVQRSVEMSRLDEGQADQVQRRADVVLGVSYLTTGVHNGPDHRAATVRVVPQASTKALSYELSDALAYSGTAATAAAGLSKEWDMQLARSLLSNDVPRREGAHAREKDLAREVYGLLADQKNKPVGHSDALLRMVECHRSDIRKIMGAADMQDLRYKTVNIRLYVGAAANVNDPTMAPNNPVMQDGQNQYRDMATAIPIGTVPGAARLMVQADIQANAGSLMLYRVKRLRREKLDYLLDTSLRSMDKLTFLASTKLEFQALKVLAAITQANGVNVEFELGNQWPVNLRARWNTVTSLIEHQRLSGSMTVFCLKDTPVKRVLGGDECLWDAGTFAVHQTSWYTTKQSRVMTENSDAGNDAYTSLQDGADVPTVTPVGAAARDVATAMSTPHGWVTLGEDHPDLDEIIVYTSNGQIRLFEADVINPEVLSQILDCLVQLIVEKYEVSVGAQTKAYCFGTHKTMLVPAQYGETIADAANANQDVAMAVAVPPSLMEMVAIGEPVAEGQWLARMMAIAEGATIKVRAPWRQTEQGMGNLAYLEAYALMARAEAVSAQVLQFDRSMTVDFMRDILSEAVPPQSANIQINEQVAAFRAKVHENGLEDFFKKQAAIQNGF